MNLRQLRHVDVNPAVLGGLVHRGEPQILGHGYSLRRRAENKVGPQIEPNIETTAARPA